MGGWCDAELVSNKITREARSQDVSELSATIEELTADIAQLTQDLADLAAGIQELKEAKEAQAAVEEAIAVVKDYYAKSAEATAFAQERQVQTPLEDAPETFDKPYKGLMPEGGNVVDFLEVILSD